MIEEMSQSRRKMLAALKLPKGRKEEQLFLAEGMKCIVELLGCYTCRILAATAGWYAAHSDLLPRIGDAVLLKASRADLERITSFATAPDVIAAFEMPERNPDLPDLHAGITLALDGVQDPGNLGTIIRTCNWFGVKQIICSRDTVDIYNPKVIQSTMGAIGRVDVRYLDLDTALEDASVPVYGTFLDGEDIYTAPLETPAVIVMGNEGRGVRSAVAATTTRRLYIPPFPRDAAHVESLNVSVATAITLALFRK